jgi:hypothetical protein
MSIQAPDPARGLRRLLLVGVLLALAGAGVALGIFLARGSPSKPSIFPARFSESGFLSGSARLDHSYDAAPGATRVTGQLTPGRTSYLVALCDHGGMVVKAGSVTTSQPCTGQPVGVIALQAPRAETVTATVTEPQTHSWGLAIYR